MRTTFKPQTRGAGVPRLPVESGRTMSAADGTEREALVIAALVIAGYAKAGLALLAL